MPLAAVMATILVLEAQLAVVLAGGGRLDAEVGQADRPEGTASHQLRSRAAAGGRGQGLG
jgi:hypothetical protein